MKSLYEELGVSASASTEEIKTAYRRRVRETHPDAGGNADEFRRVQQAYDVLADADSRRRYDEQGLDSEKVLGVPSGAEILAKALSELISDPTAPVQSLDSVRTLRSMLTGTSKRIAKEAAKKRRRLTELEGIAARLERNGGDAILEGVMESWMKPVRGGIATDEAWVENLTEAEGILDRYRDRGPSCGPALMSDLFFSTPSFSKPKPVPKAKPRRRAA
jgi:curved DNA-binding protein CbpA